MDLGRSNNNYNSTVSSSVNGLSWLNQILIDQQHHLQHLIESNTATATATDITSIPVAHDVAASCQLINKIIRCIASACAYPEFVSSYVDVNTVNSASLSSSSLSLNLLTSTTLPKVSFHSLCQSYVSIAKHIGINNPFYQQITQNSLSLAIQILKHIPLIVTTAATSSPESESQQSADGSRDKDPELYVTESTCTAMLQGLMTALLTKDPEVFSLASELFTAFISEAPGMYVYECAHVFVYV